MLLHVKCISYAIFKVFSLYLRTSKLTLRLIHDLVLLGVFSHEFFIHLNTSPSILVPSICTNTKKVSLSLARTQSQILFLHFCLSHGIPPNGFTIKLPISGCNPSLYNILHLLRFCQSMLLSKLILQNHQNQALEVLQHVSSIQKILLLCNLKYLIPSPRPTPLPSKC